MHLDSSSEEECEYTVEDNSCEIVFITHGLVPVNNMDDFYVKAGKYIGKYINQQSERDKIINKCTLNIDDTDISVSFDKDLFYLHITASREFFSDSQTCEVIDEIIKECECVKLANLYIYSAEYIENYDMAMSLFETTTCSKYQKKYAKKYLSNIIYENIELKPLEKYYAHPNSLYYLRLGPRIEKYPESVNNIKNLKIISSSSARLINFINTLNKLGYEFDTLILHIKCKENKELKDMVSTIKAKKIEFFVSPR